MKLGDYTKFKGGSAFSQDEQGNKSGILPFLKVSDLGHEPGSWYTNRANHWLLEDQVRRLKPTIAPASASVFAKIGEGLKRERIRILSRESAIDNNMMMAVPINGTNPKFLYYLLGSISLKRHAVGSALPYLKQSTLAEIAVPVFTLSEQQAIAEVLGALDDKIAVNTKLVQTAWDLTHAMFTSLPREADSEPLGAIINLVYGKALPATKRVEGAHKVVGSGGITGSHNVSLVDSSGVVVGRKGSVGAVYWINGAHWPIDTTFYVVPLRPEVSQAFMYFILKSLPLNQMNNDSAVPGLNRSEALALPVRIPIRQALSRFNETSDELIRLATQHDSENATLIKMRDVLLPQLVSGKLRVKDAEKLVSDAI